MAGALAGACARARPPVVAGTLPPGVAPDEKTAAAWRPWGLPAFDEARAERRPVLVVLSRRDTPAPVGAEAASRWSARAVLVYADPDEVPELADFAEVASTVLERQRGYPMALLLTPEGVPLAIASDAGFPSEVDGLLARHGTLPAARVADGPSLQAIRRTQQPLKAARPLSGDVAEARARRLAGVSVGAAAGGSLLLLVEAHDTLHFGTAGESASRALQSASRGAAGDRLSDAAWRLWMHARLSDGSPGRHADEATALIAWTESVIDPSGLFHEQVGDPRVFTASNGIAIAGLATAGQRLSRPAETVRAARAAEALLARLGPAGALRRGDEGERSFGRARLDDYASLGLGLIALHEATSEARWLKEADALAAAAVAALWDSADGGFFLHAEPIAPLPVRVRTGFDGPKPAANALMALFLDELGTRLGRAQYRDLARRTVEAFAGELQQARSGVDGLMAAALRILPQADATAAPPPLASSAAAARIVRGAVTLEARLMREPMRAGERAQIQVAVRTSDGWTVTPHRPGDRGAVPLSVALLEPDLGAGPAVYPTAAARLITALVPLRVPDDAPAGRREVRVSVRFEACAPGGGACLPPERQILGVPLTVTR